MKSNKLNKKRHVLLDVRAVRLLRKVQKVLRLHPERYDQGEDRKPLRKECGSPSCICGWMRFFAGSESTWDRNPQEVFLTYLQFKNLFHRRHWPIEWRGDGLNTGTSPEVAISRINHFIETDGVE